MSVLSLENINELTNRKMVTTMVLSNRQRIIKRAFDITVTSFTLFMVLPVMLAVAIAIKFTSDGAVLSSETCVDESGNSFNMYTFRTMNGTSVGRTIHNTHLDELPKLFNVIKGDISLV